MTAFNEEESRQRAREQVRRIQLFYIHLAGYVLLVLLIFYNFYIMDDSPYAPAVTFVNTTVLIGWTIFIILHGWRVFKGRILFKKEWEDRKIESFVNESKEEETTMWE